MLNIDRFRNLRAAENDLIHKWFRKAESQSRCRPEDAFEPFIYCWIAFNGWYACMFSLTTDRDCVMRVARDPDISIIFKKLLEDAEFRKVADKFRQRWPIPKLRRKRSGPSRTDEVSPESDLNLENVLLQIYQVRNNLFHGGKSVSRQNDQDLVFFSFRLLVRLMAKLLEPHTP